MPDLINPLFDSQNNISKPDIPVDIQFPTWKRPTIEVPSILKESQSAFDEHPSNEISLFDFSNIVNNKIVSDDLKKKEQDDQLMSSIRPTIKLADQDFNFRHFSSAEAMRYKRNDRLWNKIGYNPEMPTDITDAIYDHNETKWESIKNVFPKLWNTTSFAFKNYFAEYADAAKAISHLDANLLHNSSRFAQQLMEQKELENLYPDYKTDNEVRWWQLHRGDFWEESSSSLGFTIGTMGAALLENAVISAATMGFGEAAEIYNTPRKVFKAISDYYSLKRAYGLMKGVVGAKTVLGKVGNAANVWRLTNGALSEAAFEAANNKHEFLESWKEEYIKTHGIAPSAEEVRQAEKVGDEMAKATILFQTPFLMASNAAQFGNIIAPKTIAKLSEKIGMQKAAHKLVNDAAFNTIVESTEEAGKKSMFSKVLSPVKNSLWEGSEESYQALITKSTQDYYKNKYYNKEEQSILGSLNAGFDYITSNEGLKEFAAGFATGSMFTLAGKPLHWAAKAKEVEVINEDTKEVEKKYKYNFLNKLGFGMEGVQKEMEKDNLQKVANALNAVTVDNVLKEEGFLNLIKDKKTALALAKYMENNDMFNMQNVQNLQLSRMLFAGLTTGKIDLQIEKLQQFAQQDFDTLKDFFDLDENDYQKPEDKEAFLESFRNFAASLNDKASEFEKIFESEKGQYKKILNQVSSDHNKNINKYNFFLKELQDKYSTDTTEELENKITEEEKIALQELNKDLIETKFRFYAANEAVKASVFAQVGMKEDAKRAQSIINQLQKNNTVNVPYGELGRFFDRDYRDKKLKSLEARYEIAKNTEDGNLSLISEQSEAFIELSKLLNRQFDQGKKYKENEVADALQNYLYAVEKEINKIDNNTSIPDRIKKEEGIQFKLLKDFVKLQNKQQENLNLYNYLSGEHNREEFMKFQSKKLTDFFMSAIDLSLEEDKKKKVTEAPADSTVDVETEEVTTVTNDSTTTTTDAQPEVTTTTPTPTPVPEEKPPVPAETKGGKENIDIVGETEVHSNTLLDENVVDTSLPGEVHQDTPISWEFSSISSKRDTEEVDEETEQLTSNTYDLMRAEFIKKFMQPNIPEGYKMFIVQDTFSEIYVGNNDLVEIVNGKPQFKDPSKVGQVIVLEKEDGTRPTVGEFFGGQYPEHQSKPLVFSFDNGMWFKEPFYSHRVAIKAEKYEITPAEVIAEFNEERRLLNKAREIAKENPEDKLEIKAIQSTGGIYPKTKYAPVQKRFGEFDLEVILPTAQGSKTSSQFGGKYKIGMVIAKVGKTDFPVTTNTLSKAPELLAQIEAILKHKFTDAKQAERVRNEFLSVMINTNPKTQFFTVDKDGEHFVINFRKAKDEDVVNGASNKLVRKNGVIINNEIKNQRINVSNQALKDGYRTFDLRTGKEERLTADDYKQFIKPHVITNRKKILDSKGKLYMGSVNPYFSFYVADERVDVPPSAEEIQNAHYSKMKARINELIRLNQIDYPKIVGYLKADLGKKQLNKVQHDELLALIEPFNPANKKEEKKDQTLRQKALSRIEEYKGQHSAVIFNEKGPTISKTFKSEQEAKDWINKVYDIEDKRKEDLARLTVAEYQSKAPAINKKYDELIEALNKPVDNGEISSLEKQFNDKFSKIYPTKSGGIALKTKNDSTTTLEDYPEYLSIVYNKLSTEDKNNYIAYIKQKLDGIPEEIKNAEISARRMSGTGPDGEMRVSEFVGNVRKRERKLQSILDFFVENKEESVTPNLQGDKKAGIERRRQEELQKNKEKIKQEKDKDFENLSITEVEINTKYDAELAALEGKKDVPLSDKAQSVKAAMGAVTSGVTESLNDALIEQVKKGTFWTGQIQTAQQVLSKLPQGEYEIVPKEDTRERISEGVKEQFTIKGFTIMEVKKQSPKDKYKNRQMNDINKIINSTPEESTTYEVKMGSSSFTYNPENNKFYVDMGAGIEEYAPAGNTYRRVIEQFVQKYPYKTTPNGVEGFLKFELQGKEQNFVIYNGPTKIAEAELIFDARTGMQIKEGVESLESKLDEAGKVKLEEFLKRNCV